MKYIAVFLGGALPIIFFGHIADRIGDTMSLFIFFVSYFVLFLFVKLNIYNNSSYRISLSLSWLFCFTLLFLENSYLLSMIGLGLLIISITAFFAAKYTYMGSRLNSLASLTLAIIIIYATSYFKPLILMNESEQKVTNSISIYTSDNTLLKIDSSEVSLKEYDGKILLIDFWYLNCPACKLKLEYLDRLSKMYRSNHNVKIITIVNGDINSFKEFKKFLNENKKWKNLVTYYDPNGKFIKFLGLNTEGYPLEIIFDSKGVKKDKLLGFGSFNDVYVERTVDKINQIGK